MDNRNPGTDDPNRYTADIDMRNINDSHTFAVASVQGGTRVLDVGAADGSVAAVLSRMGCSVWGIELEEDAARQAGRWCERVVVGDLEALDLGSSLEGKFDVILCLDVLEHLRDPLAALRGLSDFLSDSGYFVISLPNVAHAAVRVQMMTTGRFRYTELGLLDNTHLRFFDPESVYEFIGDANLEIFDESEVSFGLSETEIPIDLDNVPPEVAARADTAQRAHTYQFLFLAAPVGSSVLANPPFLPAREVQREARRLQQEGTVSVRRADLRSELEDLRAMGEVRQQALRELLAHLERSRQ